MDAKREKREDYLRMKNNSSLIHLNSPFLLLIQPSSIQVIGDVTPFIPTFPPLLPLPLPFFLPFLSPFTESSIKLRSGIEGEMGLGTEGKMFL